MEEDEPKDNSGWVDDGAEYSPKSEFSKPEVVQEAVKRCITLRAKEMKKGYFNTLFSKEGLPLRTWIEDSRKAYCSSVQALRSLIIPEILEDKDNYEVVKMEESYDKFSYSPIEVKKVNGENVYKNSETTWIPEIDEKVSVRKIFPDGSMELVQIIGYWNSKVNAYWDAMVLQHDLLFEELIKVIHRLDYYKVGEI